MGLRPTDPADAATLQSLAQDRAPQVREAAVKRLTDLPTLRGYLGKDPDQRVRTAAAVRYRQLLIGDTDTETVRRELERARDPTLLAHIAQQGRAPEVRRAALERLGDQAVLAQIARDDAAPENRQAASARLEALRGATPSKGAASPPEPAAAEAAETAATAPPPPRREPPAAAAGEPSEAEALCTAMETLADRLWYPGLHRRRRRLMDRWRALPEAPPEALRRRFRAATIRILLHQPRHGGEASRARAQCRSLLEQAEAGGDPDALRQRLASLTRSFADLRGDHPDEARARLLLQRLWRRLEAEHWPSPLRAEAAQPRPEATVLLEKVEEIELAVARGQLAAAQRRIIEARRLLSPSR